MSAVGKWLAGVVGAAAIAAMVWSSRGGGDGVKPLSEADVVAIGELVAGKTPADLPKNLTAASEGVHAFGFRAGARVGEHYADDGTVADSVTAAVNAIGGAADTVALCVARNRRGADPVAIKSRQDDAHAGVVGLELVADGAMSRTSPLTTVVDNRGPRGAITTMARKRGMPNDAEGWGHMTATWFDCDQVLVTLGDAPRAQRMFRGNQVVDVAAVTRERIEQTAASLTDYLRRNLGSGGAMTYLVEPSRAEPRPGDNAIRQWMATIALVRRSAVEADLVPLAALNIDHNLGRMFRIEDGLGVIQIDGKEAKLGAAALALIALTSHPERARWAVQAEALYRLTTHLHGEDGRFTTFFKPKKDPSERSHNFYPGETLLAWALRYAEAPDPVLLDRYMKSFAHYRDWHRANKNPAFVPWHTQAHFAMWQQTRDDGLKDFIFEMNDWLVDYQEWDAAIHPDTRGRFYDAKRPQYGPPHASSTGVYLEGLIDAHQLAVAVGDTARAERYRLAIRRGLRSVLQLVFEDDVDLFYVADRERVRGGVRTTVHHNVIRVDNVQHNLLAIMKILAAWDAAVFGD